MHRIEFPEWAKTIALKFGEIEPTRTAVLVIDLQNFFISGGLPIPTAYEIIPNVNRLTQAFRAAGSTIVYIRHTVSDDPAFALADWRRDPKFAKGSAAASFEFLRSGNPQHGLHPELDVHEQDWIVDKHRYSAMLPNSSALHQRLVEQGIDTLIITGAATHVCCESTARDAAMLDYRVFFLADATATQNDALHNATLQNIGQLFADIRTTANMLELLQAAGRVN